MVSAYKIWLLATQKSVYWFAFSHSVEYGVIGIAMLVIYHKLGNQRLSFSWKLAKEMFSRSKYYIVANLMVVIYNRTGNVLLKFFCGNAENGFFATAITCTCITGFVFDAITNTARPVALESLKQSQEKFERNIACIYSITTWLCIAQSVFFTILAKPIVVFLYGVDFIPAIPVLQILIWNSAFSYMGVVRNIWILGAEKHDVLWKINSLGALANVIFNVIFIPIWGACGAAFASVLTQIFTNFILGFLMPSIRPNNRLMLKGLNPCILWPLWKEFRD